MKTRVRTVGKVQVIGLRGKLILGRTEGLTRALKKLVAGRQKRILVDLRRVPYMDSAGIGELAAWRREARRENVALKLLKLNPQYQLDVEFLLSLIYPGAQFDDELQAVASF